MTRRDKALALFDPDRSGCSEWVPVSEFKAAGLPWSTNGNLRRGAPWNLTDIKWETLRENDHPRGRITALRMAGWDETPVFRQQIDNRVLKHFEFVPPVCNLSLVPLSPSDREVDHRFGYKSHPDYIALYKPGAQSPEDFQWIHRSLNLKKRQMCKDCITFRKRPAHPDAGFVEGSDVLADRFPCRGCYLAEPERYRSTPGNRRS